ncbi:CBS domain-containing protein [Streptacidiphilus neutrinimicus]|uniref:CBS domain-containing protein n=1 Tax=Streptacidiphilus neutrinimicus TaxID=105420 RepID=UPI0005AB06CE|nr:CBS domain-containing protein [Streptacidiphilus neutrinimicus]
MLVRDVMNSPAVTVGPGDSIRRAAESMRAHDVGCVLVTVGGVPLGVVTDRDITVRAVAPGRDLEAPVTTVMSEPVVTVDADTDLADAYGAFRRTGRRRLPAVVQGRVVGLLAVDDLFLDVFQRFADLLGPVSWSTLTDEPLDEGPLGEAV